MATPGRALDHIRRKTLQLKDLQVVVLDEADELWDEVGYVEEELGDEGRVLVRASGTEPLIRIMVEAASEADARRYADRLSAFTESSLGKG